eukprot:scaffold130000_cov16-Prasinocladus_malaysianus.AAC.1
MRGLDMIIRCNASGPTSSRCALVSQPGDAAGSMPSPARPPRRLTSRPRSVSASLALDSGRTASPAPKVISS